MNLLQTDACRHGRSRLSSALEIPVGPGAWIENTGRSMIQYFAELLFPNHATKGHQVLDGAESHDVGQKMHRVDQCLGGFFEPNDTACHGQQLRGGRQGLHGANPFPTGRRTYGNNTLEILSKTIIFVHRKIREQQVGRTSLRKFFASAGTCFALKHYWAGITVAS